MDFGFDFDAILQIFLPPKMSNLTEKDINARISEITVAIEKKESDIKECEAKIEKKEVEIEEMRAGIERKEVAIDAKDIEINRLRRQKNVKLDNATDGIDTVVDANYSLEEMQILKEAKERLIRDKEDLQVDKKGLQEDKKNLQEYKKSLQEDKNKLFRRLEEYDQLLMGGIVPGGIAEQVKRALENSETGSGVSKKSNTSRPGQSEFRDRLRKVYGQCPIYNTAAEGCDASHLVPYAYWKHYPVNLIFHNRKDGMPIIGDFVQNGIMELMMSEMEFSWIRRFIDTLTDISLPSIEKKSEQMFNLS